MRIDHASYKERIEVHLLCDISWSYSQISQKLSLSKRQVQYFSHQPATPKKRPGRPLILNTHKQERIINFVISSSEHRRLAYWAVMEVMDLDVSVETLQHTLEQEGFSRCITRIQPYIPPRTSETRFNWALIHASWTIKSWRCMLWTYESAIQVLGQGRA
jgi:hypothetical protein